MADELRLKGFEGREEEGISSRQSSSKTDYNLFTTFKDKTSSQRLQNEVVLSRSTETAIAQDNPPANTDIAELDQKVRSLMSFSENRIDKTKNTRARICKVCGKEGQNINIKHHIEANHLTDISIPCNSCGKISSTRNALNAHKRICKFQPGFFSQ